MLIHGAFGTIESCFAELLPALARHFDVVAVEMQGHGRTRDVARPLSYEDMAADTAALLDALDISRAHIVGYSMGGAVGLELALDRPELVDRLVFAGGAAFDASGEHPELIAGYESFDPHELDGSRWHEAYRRVAPDPDAWTSLVVKLNELDRAGHSWPRERIAGMKAPTLLINGDADIVRPEHVVEMFRILGGGVPCGLVELPPSQLALLPGTSHEGVLDRVDWLSSMILAFLRTRGEAVTPQTQVPAAARDGFVTYDELRGPGLDAARWSPARLPLPTGEHIPLDPNAELAVGEGEVRVTIERFSLSHDRFQAADSPSTSPSRLAAGSCRPTGPATFAVDLAVENIGGEPGDFRRGMAAFHVFDLDVSQRVFAVCGTSTRVLALHEQLGLGAGCAGEPFYHVVESPYEDFNDDFTRLRACELMLDRSRSTATWRVDGRAVYEAQGTLIPEHARIGFGIWTMLPIRDGRSRSLDNQGMSARWRRFRVSGALDR